MMTPEEYRNASKRYRNVSMSMSGSGQDYISGRCLVMNHFLIPGLILQVVGIEKMMKAITACEDSEGNIKKARHDLQKLFNEVCTYPDYDIKRFSHYIPKMEEIYRMRYHDSERVSNSFTYGGPVDNGVLDDFYAELLDQIKLIPEFKYRCGLMAMIFDPYDRQNKKWALLNNPYLAYKIPKWKPMSEKYYLKDFRRID